MLNDSHLGLSSESETALESIVNKWLWLKKVERYQNGTWVIRTKAHHLRNRSSLTLSHTQIFVGSASK